MSTHEEQRAKLVEMMVEAVIIQRHDDGERIFWREKFIRAIRELHGHYTVNAWTDRERRMHGDDLTKPEGE
jgi:hypothetical protein